MFELLSSETHNFPCTNIEQFSIGYCKTKTKVITLANHKGHKQSSEPIKTRRYYM